MILFLDFDGVLHPSSVYLRNGKPVLDADGELFMWAPLLVDALSDFPDCQIVLSTNWVRRLDFELTRDFLPVGLRERVIGSTWYSVMKTPGYNDGLTFSYWSDATRHQQIKHWVQFNGLSAGKWVAIDDDASGWHESDSGNLVLVDGNIGLSDATKMKMLKSKLAS